MTMKCYRLTRVGVVVAAAIALGLSAAPPASATISGLTGTSFNLTAGVGELSMPDGPTVVFWGFGADGAVPQYPGPTLIVPEDTLITINVTNTLDEPVSLVFPGLVPAIQPAPVFVGGVRAGLRSLTYEVPPGGGPIAYQFTAPDPGTYIYKSSTNMAKQVYMGLAGAIVVRPADYAETGAANTELSHAQLTRHAYGAVGDATGTSTSYQREYLLVETEIDPNINFAIENGMEPDFTAWHPVYWMFNGRCFPDTVLPDGVPWLPHQPYGALNAVHPGETALVRMVNLGRDPHPFHPHGNHIRLIAHDGNVLQTAVSAGVDLSQMVYTHSYQPGQTYDGLWEWDGRDMGWDIYGDRVHDCIDNVNNATGAPGADGFGDPYPLSDPFAATPSYPYEDCGADSHNVAIPVDFPNELSLTFGGFYSGSPYMGAAGALPPGEGGLNPYSGYFFVWHSHAEQELTNNDIFIGGMLTQMVVLPFDAPISY
jgi:FtsP/CotA-like multicopper oxidase with cupredoxin domain